MSTQNPAAYHAAVEAAFNAAVARIKSGQLRKSSAQANSNKVIAWFAVTGLDPTKEESFTAAFDALITKLDWDIKPAKLLALERESKVTIIPVAPTLDNTFEAKLRAGEKADAKAKADKASITQAKDLISAYLPVKSTARGQVVDYADQTLMQTEWGKTLTQAIEKKRNLQEFAKTLAATIQKRYRDREKASERL